MFLNIPKKIYKIDGYSYYESNITIFKHMAFNYEVGEYVNKKRLLKDNFR